MVKLIDANIPELSTEDKKCLRLCSSKVPNIAKFRPKYHFGLNLNLNLKSEAFLLDYIDDYLVDEECLDIWYWIQDFGKLIFWNLVLDFDIVLQYWMIENIESNLVDGEGLQHSMPCHYCLVLLFKYHILVAEY